MTVQELRDLIDDAIDTRGVSPNSDVFLDVPRGKWGGFGIWADVEYEWNEGWYKVVEGILTIRPKE
jgi:hypothetical protein